ncbi:MAG: mechanosensitive ion channel family protein [Deltaproteobacteria bacterium]|nr:mechanosensitive ion channel family protein [Deltaproteobacteria bacterium]MBW2330842.1 mechanosensitive ion channel family protein [Deltaproteobacteria bacterium]
MRILKAVIYGQIYKIATKTDNVWDNLAAELINRIKPFFLLTIALYLGSLLLSLPETIMDIIGKFVGVVILIQLAILGSYIISFWVNRHKKEKVELDAAAVTTFTAVGFIIRIILWSIIVLIALDNLGVDVTALIAGLGISGVAVALAVQNILGDLFASFSIVLDRPFVIGDFIIVDDHLGTVEHIGLKTTRVRSLSGEQLVFSNADLLTSRIRNYKRMFERRVVFSVGVVYQTPYEKLKKIPALIQEIIEAQEQVRFDRAHFKDYGPYSLNFEIVYWVKDPDYNIYMNIQQAINLAIFQGFEKKGIEFAYPTQLLYINKTSSLAPSFTE